jgi:hypothetical protein
MPHSVIIMREKLNALRGNADTGNIYDLQTVVEKTEVAINSDHENAEAMHEKMEEVQAFLCDGGTLTVGVTEKVQDFTAELVALNPE